MRGISVVMEKMDMIPDFAIKCVAFSGSVTKPVKLFSTIKP